MTVYKEIGIEIFWIKLVGEVLTLHNDALSMEEIIERMRSIESTFVELE